MHSARQKRLDRYARLKRERRCVRCEVALGSGSERVRCDKCRREAAASVTRTKARRMVARVCYECGRVNVTEPGERCQRCIRRPKTPAAHAAAAQA